MWRTALALARFAPVREGAKLALPPLLFFTDPLRTTDPVAAAETLPSGAGVVYRHFGREDAGAVGLALARVARRRRLVLLTGGDEALAAALGAAGVHLPERRAFEAVRLRARRPGWLITVAAHGARALAEAGRVGADAAVLSAVFASRSPSASAALGAVRTALLIGSASIPVYGLGGMNAVTSKRLLAMGAVGLAAVESLIEPPPERLGAGNQN